MDWFIRAMCGRKHEGMVEACMLPADLRKARGYALTSTW